MFSHLTESASSPLHGFCMVVMMMVVMTMPTMLMLMISGDAEDDNEDDGCHSMVRVQL